MDALIEATSELILERGVTMSVRDIAQRAGVNHGLVHTYFGSKDALLTAAFGSITDRAAAELDEHGFPPADLAFRRGGEVARALARAMLDVTGDPYPSHPILPTWRAALAPIVPDQPVPNSTRPSSSQPRSGWAGRCSPNTSASILDVDEAEQADVIEQRVLALVSDIGGIPDGDSLGHLRRFVIRLASLVEKGDM